MNELVKGIEMVATTPMGAERIKRNLGFCAENELDAEGVMALSRNKILA